MAKNTFPSDWRDQPCFLVAIPRPLVPFVGGLLKLPEQRGFWLSEDDYINGYQATIELEGCLMATCLQDFMQLQEAQYRMLNTAMFGLTYETVSTDPLVVTPAIAPHVTLDRHNEDGVLFLMDRLTQMLDNRLAGTETPLYSDLPGIKQQLQSIIDALAEGTDLSGVITELEGIAVLLG